MNATREESLQLSVINKNKLKQAIVIQSYCQLAIKVVAQSVKPRRSVLLLETH